MIPWQATSHDRIEVRPAYGTIPVAPGQHIVGWEVRVWHEGPDALNVCDTCKRRCNSREISVLAANGRPDAALLKPTHNDGYVWAPYAHECSAPVPWSARSAWLSQGWQQPHHHPNSTEPFDSDARPVLYPNAQLAYAAGLELLGIDVPERMHWKLPQSQESHGARPKA